MQRTVVCSSKRDARITLRHTLMRTAVAARFPADASVGAGLSCCKRKPPSPRGTEGEPSASHTIARIDARVWRALAMASSDCDWVQMLAAALMCAWSDSLVLSACKSHSQVVRSPPAPLDPLDLSISDPQHPLQSYIPPKVKRIPRRLSRPPSPLDHSRCWWATAWRHDGQQKRDEGRGGLRKPLPLPRRRAFPRSAALSPLDTAAAAVPLPPVSVISSLRRPPPAADDVARPAAWNVGWEEPFLLIAHVRGGSLRCS